MNECKNIYIREKVNGKWMVAEAEFLALLIENEKLKQTLIYVRNCSSALKCSECQDRVKQALPDTEDKK